MNDVPRRIIRNTLTNSISYAFLFLSNLFLIPFIVYRLGMENYGGIWVVIGTLTAYMGLLDLGTGTAFVKFIAEYHTKKEERSLIEVVNTGIGAYLGFGVVVLSVALILDVQILRLVGVPAAVFEDARFVFGVGMVILVVVNILSPLTSILPGIQRMDVQSYVSIASQSVNIAGTIYVLNAGFGIRGLILNNLLVAGLSTCASAALAFRFLPYLRISVRYWSWRRATQMLAYGFNLQISRLAEIVVFQTDRILSLRFFGSTFATQYDVSARLNSAARSASFLLISALIPAFSELDAKQQREQLLMLYRRGSKYISVSASFIFGYLLFFAPDILAVWMGESFAASANIVRILAIGYWANIVTGAASAMSAGLGTTYLSRRYGVFVALFNIAATLLGMLAFGPIGIAAGTTVTLVLGAIYFIRAFHSHLSLATGPFVALLVRPVGIAVCAGGFAMLVPLLCPTVWAPASHLVRLLVFFSLYTGVYGVLTIGMKVFDPADLQLARSILRRH